MTRRRVRLAELLDDGTADLVPTPREGLVRLAGIRLHGGGVYEARAVPGVEIKEKALTPLQPGAFIYSRMAATGGAFAIVPDSAAGMYVTRTFLQFRIDEESVDPRYLELLTQASAFLDQVDAAAVGSTGRRFLRPAALLELEVDLPPLDEQRRIVEAVEAATRAQRAFEAAVRERERVYQALVPELVSGDQVPLQDIVQKIEAGVSLRYLRRRPRPGECGILSTAAVRHGHFRGDEAKALPPGTQVKESALVRPGDLLTISGGGVPGPGVMCIATAHPSRLVMSAYHWRLTLRESYDPRYIMHATAAPEVRSQIDDATLGSTAARGISQARYLAVVVPVPGLSDQLRVADRLDAALQSVLAYRHAASAAASFTRALTEELLTGRRT